MKSVTGMDSLIGTVSAELLDTSSITPASNVRNTSGCPFKISFNLLISAVVKSITISLFEGADVFTSASLNVNIAALTLFDALKCMLLTIRVDS